MSDARTAAIIGVLTLVLFMSMMAQAGDDDDDNGERRFQVNCDKGQTITRALKRARPGDTIKVKGTCRERVIITTDGVTLDGQDRATLEGEGGGAPGELSEGLITIEGARGVVITGFTVSDSPVDGITGRRGAVFTVRDTEVLSSADDGIEIIENSSATLHNCTVTGDRENGRGEFGINVARDSNADFTGHIASTNNTSAGIIISSNSNALFREGEVQANSNGQRGILVLHSASATLSRLGPNITTKENAQQGILVFEGGNLQASGGTINAIDNEPPATGIVISVGSTFVNFGTSVVVERNGTGLIIAGNSTVLHTPGGQLLIQDNNTGLLASNNSAVTLQTPTPLSKRVTIQENKNVDVNLIFGTAATLDGTIDTIRCDETVISRGSVQCP